MDNSTVFSKTGKGLLEIKSKSNRLSKDQFRVLNLVDGKATLADLVSMGCVPPGPMCPLAPPVEAR